VIEASRGQKGKTDYFWARSAPDCRTPSEPPKSSRSNVPSMTGPAVSFPLLLRCCGKINQERCDFYLGHIQLPFGFRSSQSFYLPISKRMECQKATSSHFPPIFSNF